MPKVKSMMSKEKKQAERDEVKAKAIRGAIWEIRGRYRLAQYELAARVGMDKGTLSKRLKNPRDFTLDELWRIENEFPEFAITF